MRYHLLVILSLLACTASAQTTPAASAKQPTVLRPRHMQAQARPAANRPDVAPQFPGGQKALGQFVQEQVQYPEAARSKQLSGHVLTTFVVATDGKLTQPKVVQGLSPECDAEALRVLSLMPAWKPATRKGQPVAVQVQVPIPFGNSATLQVEKSKVKFE
ncbi:energy transducer TonB [Solirubrum puertoriconensis]|uniref:energy transducer TonB n=1 Tax=Solirubrum puertoriconensis TaxID=1751427 RepID=UPI00122E7A8D|nr:energy transducer TonB [Solirubrum puertoriconensis]